MAEKENTNQTQAAIDSKACPGDCARCSFVQRNYCASAMGRNIQDLVAVLIGEVRMLSAKVDALTHGEILDAPVPVEAPASDAQ